MIWPGPAASTANGKISHHAWKRTAENPLKNVEVIAGAVDGQTTEIKLIKWLSFKPTKVVKTIDDAVYSDTVNTDDEIQATLHDIDVAKKEALINAEKLAAERQQVLDLALRNEKSWLKE